MKYNLRSLQVFEAVARNESITLAAKELRISPSAVSHQMSNLSRNIGERLIERAGRRIFLTAVGMRLATTLRGVFRQIDDTIGHDIGSQKSNIRLAVCSSFGPGWIIPRLRNLKEAIPSAEIELRMFANDPLLANTVADAFVTADEVIRGFSAVRLFDEELIPVSLTGGFDDQPLITTSMARHRYAADWTAYAREHELKSRQFEQKQFVSCSHYVFALELARAGMGIALVPDFLAREKIAHGPLKIVGQATVRSGRSYNFVVKDARKDEPVLFALARWFAEQAASIRAANRAPARSRRRTTI